MSDLRAGIVVTGTEVLTGRIADRKWKSPRDLIRYLAKAAGMNANFLLNVGPQPNGKLQAEQVERLKVMGQWLKVNGASIYGTRGGPIPPRPWGVTTRNDKTVYLHVFDWADPQLLIPSVGAVKLLFTHRLGKSAVPNVFR